MGMAACVRRKPPTNVARDGIVLERSSKKRTKIASKRDTFIEFENVLSQAMEADDRRLKNDNL